MAGGGLTGYHGGSYSSGSGGSQTAGGSGYKSNYYGTSGSGTFGSGGYGNSHAGGGGGGYYGGGGGARDSTYDGSGGGGSSFISGHIGCDAIDSNGVHTGQSVHYSGYKFTNTIMIDGAGYNWTTVKGSYVGQIQPDGTTTTGHSGNGYARITLIYID